MQYYIIFLYEYIYLSVSNDHTYTQYCIVILGDFWYPVSNNIGPSKICRDFTPCTREIFHHIRHVKSSFLIYLIGKYSSLLDRKMILDFSSLIILMVIMHLH